jgi:hypothetical protein
LQQEYAPAIVEKKNSESCFGKPNPSAAQANVCYGFSLQVEFAGITPRLADRETLSLVAHPKGSSKAPSPRIALPQTALD